MKATLIRDFKSEKGFFYKKGETFCVVKKYPKVARLEGRTGFCYIPNELLEFEKEVNEPFRVNVFVTKNCKFRAEVQRPDGTFYQVTVGGQEWKKGKGKECEEIITDKVVSIITSLTSEIGHLIKPKQDGK